MFMDFPVPQGYITAYSPQMGVIRAIAKSAVCIVNLSANGAKVAGKVPAKDF